MKCSFCQREFNDEQVKDACQGCPSGGGCHMVKCPYCGYESPREPGLIKKIRSFLKANDREKKS